ncbi:hypothetical protein DNTS_034017 [Danionella cerebrum]|uniref:Chemokine interleukin-8-like domain-containing protein n=1 Tax=Danionella cerebrum TaxID=2873325 RepID=A0A553QBK8_9TELE|nr:hypothetical protein DNTS_034017 [Danionella translucida]
MDRRVLTLFCILLCVLTLTQSTGQRGSAFQRCFCLDRLVKGVNPKLVIEVKYIPPSPSCSKKEIIIRQKRKGQVKSVCLDPNTEQGRRIQKGKGLQNKQQKFRGQKGKNVKSGH